MRRGGEQRTTTGILSSQPNHVLSTQTSYSHTQTHTHSYSNSYLCVCLNTASSSDFDFHTKHSGVYWLSTQILCYALYIAFSFQKCLPQGQHLFLDTLNAKWAKTWSGPFPSKKHVKTHSKSRIQNCLTRRRDEHWRKVRSAEYIENCGTRKVFEFPAR